jgi:hypothetical protein
MKASERRGSIPDGWPATSSSRSGAAVPTSFNGDLLCKIGITQSLVLQVQRAHHFLLRAALHGVGIDHRGLNIRVPE